MNDLTQLPPDVTWPFKTEGVLEISVETGDVGEDEISSLNFGTLVTSQGIYLIEVTDSVIREANMSRDNLYASKTIKAEFEGSTNYAVAQGGPPTYKVTKIEL